MFQATQAIYNELKNSNSNLKVFTEENDQRSEVWLQFTVDNGPAYRIRFISTDNDSDVAVRVFGLLRVEETKKSKMLSAINEINAQFRYVKFVMDDNNDISVQYDFPVRTVRVEASAEEILIRFVKIIDDAYPMMMRALWS